MVPFFTGGFSSNKRLKYTIPAEFETGWVKR